MISDELIKKVVEQVIIKMEEAKADVSTNKVTDTPSEEIFDITEQDLSSIYNVPDPKNREAIMNLKKATPARVGIWHSGPRYLTSSALRFQADHAAAQDAVFNEVPESFVQQMHMFEVKTKCSNKDEYLTRPDLGRKLSDDALSVIKEKCVKNPQVQIVISDGQSSSACVSNCRDIIPVLTKGLEDQGVRLGTTFFVRYGRVGVMGQIAEAINADVVVLLIGERPGLVTSESMSAYMAYKPTQGMSEANRTVVSNIHKAGTPIVEAGAHIVDLAMLMLEKKTSGTALLKLI